MLTKFTKIISSFILLTSTLSAAENFRIDADAMYRSQASQKMSTPAFTTNKVNFAHSEVNAKYTHFWKKESAYIGGIGYSQDNVEWAENPFFRETNFDTLEMSVGGLTHRIQGWQWVGALFSQVDAKELDFSHYARSGFILWGAYEYSKKLDLHVGMIARTGLRQDEVVPIIGLKFLAGERWKINAVYPLDASVAYTLTKTLNLSFSGRNNSHRHRVGKNEVLSKGIFHYRSLASELALNYQPHDRFLMAGLIGTSLGGDLKIMNSAAKNPFFYEYKSAMYAGAKVQVNF